MIRYCADIGKHAFRLRSGDLGGYDESVENIKRPDGFYVPGLKFILVVLFVLSAAVVMCLSVMKL